MVKTQLPLQGAQIRLLVGELGPHLLCGEAEQGVEKSECTISLPSLTAHFNARPPLSCRRPGISPWAGKIPWRRDDNPLQYSCLEKSMGRGAWWAAVHEVAKSQT